MILNKIGRILLHFSENANKLVAETISLRDDYRDRKGCVTAFGLLRKNGLFSDHADSVQDLTQAISGPEPGDAEADDRPG